MPGWRAMLNKESKEPMSPEEEKKLVDKLTRLSESAELQPHEEHDIDKLHYAMIERRIYPQKGKWLRFSENQIKRALDHEQEKAKEEAKEEAG